MAERKQDTGSTVPDRRLFTTDGELRSDVAEEKPAPEPAPTAAAVAAPAEPSSPAAPDSKVPPPPSDAEQKANNDAYQKSSKDLDTRVELSGHSAKELEIT